jgi:hypothetical protein
MQQIVSLTFIGDDVRCSAEAIRDEQPQFPAFVSEIGAMTLPLFVRPHETRYRA